MDLIRGDAWARSRFPVIWSDGDALADLARAKRGPLPAPLRDEMLEYHRRLGATPASIAALEQLARGDAVCAVAGQQPAPLGGPLYSLHKTAAAVGLAEVVAERTAIPCVPLFWTHGEDSDFAEVRTALVADAGFRTEELSIPADAHRDGELIGNLPTASLAAVHARALELWARHPAAGAAARLLGEATARARDLSEVTSALMLALFGSCGLVVVDPRLPAFRAAARPILDRYLAHAEALSAKARDAGALLERTVGRRPLNDASLESFVFRVHDGRRSKVTAAEARELPPGTALSPSVALRPAVQDGVFPTVAMACGAGEIAYLAQLREVFEGVQVRPACPVPRWSATWVPPAGFELIEAAGAEPWELVLATDSVLRRLAERDVPADVSQALARIRAQANDGLVDFAERAKTVDTSLHQLVESARGKVDYQYARIVDGVVGKSRHKLERRRPEWTQLRGFLLPGDRLQERRLASLEVVAYRGVEVARELGSLAAERARRLAFSEHSHLILEL